MASLAAAGLKSGKSKDREHAQKSSRVSAVIRHIRHVRLLGTGSTLSNLLTQGPGCILVVFRRRTKTGPASRPGFAIGSRLPERLFSPSRLGRKVVGQNLKRHSIMRWPFRLQRPCLADDSLRRGASAGIPGTECFGGDAKSRRALRLGEAESRADLPQGRGVFGHRSRRCHWSAPD